MTLPDTTLDTCLRPGAVAYLSCDVDQVQNRYVWGGKILATVAQHIQIKDAALTDTLSNPGQFIAGESVGWRSFTGCKIRIDGQDYLALGQEHMEPDRRGAVLLARYYLYPWKECQQATANLEALITAIGTVEDDKEPLKPGIVQSSCTSPEQHRNTEVQILKSALHAYQTGKALNFRTALLTESQFQKLEEPRLAASVPVITKGFRESTQKQIAETGSSPWSISDKVQAAFFGCALLAAALSVALWVRQRWTGTNKNSLRDIANQATQHR